HRASPQFQMKRRAPAMRARACPWSGLGSIRNRKTLRCLATDQTRYHAGVFAPRNSVHPTEGRYRGSSWVSRVLLDFPIGSNDAPDIPTPEGGGFTAILVTASTAA